MVAAINFLLKWLTENWIAYVLMTFDESHVMLKKF